VPSSTRLLRPLELGLHSLLMTLRFTERLIFFIRHRRVPDQKTKSPGRTDNQ
jgi:hypothetical protein